MTRALGTPPPSIAVSAAIDQLHARGLLSAWSADDCRDALRELVAGGDDLPPQPVDQFERLLARYYGVGLGPRGRRDRFLILSTAGRMGYSIDRPAIRCLSQLAGDLEIEVERQSDHSGWLSAGGERYHYDWLRGLGSLTVAFNRALAAAERPEVALLRSEFADDRAGSLNAWLVRAPDPTPERDLLSVMFDAR